MADIQCQHHQRLRPQAPAAGLPRYRLGLILGRMKKFTQAEQALSEAIEREPKNFDYLYALAILYLESGQLEKSLDKARQLQALMPGLPRTRQLIQKIQQEIQAAAARPQEK